MTIDLIDLREDIAGVLDDRNPNQTAAWWARTAQELLDALEQAKARIQAVEDVLDKADADKAASGWKGSSVVRTAVVRAALDD